MPEVHPTVDIRGILDGTDDDVVALAPFEAVGDGRQPLCRVLCERDLRPVGIDQLTDALLDLGVGVPATLRIVVPAEVAHIRREGVNRRYDRQRHRRYRGVVQVRTLSLNGKEGPRALRQKRFVHCSGRFRVSEIRITNAAGDTR
jgi:hypothetical protein